MHTTLKLTGRKLAGQSEASVEGREPTDIEQEFREVAGRLGIRFSEELPPLRRFFDQVDYSELADGPESEGRIRALKRLLEMVFDPKGADAEVLMDRPETVARFIDLHYGKKDQEVMGAVFVDMKNQVLAHKVFFVGTLTRAAVEPRCILARALSLAASGFLLFHTHPSGDPAPSSEDLDFTLRIVQASELLGVRLMDHLIVGQSGTWVSLKRRGAW